MPFDKNKATRLRKQAEEVLHLLENSESSDLELTPEKMSQLISELRVHQIELEMQNEELVRAQVELEKSRDKFWQLFNNAPVGYLVVDENGMVLRTNATFADMVNSSPDKILRKPFSHLIYPEDQQIFFGRFKSFFKDSHCKELELRILGDIGFFWAIISGRNNIYIEPGESKEKSIMLIVTDITERKRLEEEQKRLENRMHHFQRLESLGVLAGGIAHDFNNILTVIRGNAEICQMTMKPGGAEFGFVSEIVNATARAADLTRQMLAYAGKGFFELKVMDIAAEIRELLSLLRSSVPSTIDLETQLETDVFMARCDSGQLHQVLMNAVINASEAIADKYGIIKIKTSKVTFNSETPPFILEPDNILSEHLCVEISDNGCGMTPDIISRIFDPFFSTKFTGRGLGMASIMGIMKRHLGGIALESTPGHGSVFRYYFPLAQKEHDSAVFGSDQSEAFGSMQAMPFSGVALVIDDESEVRNVSTLILERLGFDVVSAADGREALAMIREQVRSLKLVIVDLTMPKMNGLDFFKELRRTEPSVSVLFCSGFHRSSLPEELIENPNIGFVQKPYSKDDLQREISRILE